MTYQVKKKYRPLTPYAPALCGPSDIAALKALQNGTATDYQQKIALTWIVKAASGIDEFLYHETDRDTAFALGRQFVGKQIMDVLGSQLNLNTLRRELNAQEV